MYNRLVVPRSAIPWQSASKLDLRRSEVGYDTTVWGEDEPQDFADAPYPENLDGFANDAYTSVTQTLTEQARLSLALLQEQEMQASFDSNLTAPKTSASVNEHLPFVMDDYAAARRIKVLLAKGLLNKTSSGRFVDDLSQTKSDFYADTEVPNAAASHLETTQEALDAVPSEAIETTALEHLAQPVEELEVTPEVQGITPQELLLLEEAQFAKGLAQGLEEGKALGFAEGKAQGLEEGKALGFEEGKAQGLEEGKGLGLEEAVQEALAKGKAEGIEEGLARGIEQGERQAREAMEQEVATQCEVLSQVAEGFHELLQDPQRFFDPLKRLALHMAQHMTKHELSISPQAIDALVQNCLNERKQTNRLLHSNDITTQSEKNRERCRQHHDCSSTSLSSLPRRTHGTNLDANIVSSCDECSKSIVGNTLFSSSSDRSSLMCSVQSRSSSQHKGKTRSERPPVTK
jgi:flagellar biosynthesis/type III secretory pathway protein FliH